MRCRGEMVRGSPIKVNVAKDMSSYPRNVKVGGNASAFIGEELQFQGNHRQDSRYFYLTKTIKTKVNNTKYSMDYGKA